MVRRWLIAALVAACGDGGTPAPVDAPADAATACSTPNECPCFSNDDCPDGTRCHAADPDHVYCEPGPRGTGVAGAMCTGENDCASALCVDGTDTMRCSKTCTMSTECPPELPRCLAGIGICARQP
jgi:hypothetical protein